MRLQVINSYFNPINYKNRYMRYLEFERHMLESDVDLTTVECNRPGEAHKLTSSLINHIPVSASTICWQKESQLDVGYNSIPKDCSYIGWFDGDIHFTNPNWHHDTISALQEFDIVCPWEYCHDLDADGNVAEVHESFGKVLFERNPIVQGPNLPLSIKKKFKFGHPGYAWAARRDFLEAVGGFINTAILGSCDHHMALAMIGRAYDSAPYAISPEYMEPILEWQAKALKYNPKIGYVKGNIIHGFHGSKKDRQYSDRWQILIKHGFNPKEDLYVNDHGIIELRGNKPELNRDVEQYFLDRKEDGALMAQAA